MGRLPGAAMLLTFGGLAAAPAFVHLPGSLRGAGRRVPYSGHAATSPLGPEPSALDADDGASSFVRLTAAFAAAFLVALAPAQPSLAKFNAGSIALNERAFKESDQLASDAIKAREKADALRMEAKQKETAAALFGKLDQTRKTEESARQREALAQEQKRAEVLKKLETASPKPAPAPAPAPSPSLAAPSPSPPPSPPKINPPVPSSTPAQPALKINPPVLSSSLGSSASGDEPKAQAFFRMFFQKKQEERVQEVKKDARRDDERAKVAAALEKRKLDAQQAAEEAEAVAQRVEELARSARATAEAAKLLAAAP